MLIQLAKQRLPGVGMVVTPYMKMLQPSLSHNSQIFSVLLLFISICQDSGWGKRIGACPHIYLKFHQKKWGTVKQWGQEKENLHASVTTMTLIPLIRWITHSYTHSGSCFIISDRQCACLLFYYLSNIFLWFYVDYELLLTSCWRFPFLCV